MAKFYEYVINYYNDKTYEAIIREYELVAESDTQVVYKGFQQFHIRDKNDFYGKNNFLTCEYFHGSKFLKIKPHFIAMLYAKELSHGNKKKLINFLENQVKDHFNFVKNFKLKVEFMEVNTNDTRTI